MSRRIALLTIALLAAVPAAAQAAPFNDRVATKSSTSTPTAKAAQAGSSPIDVPLIEGGSVKVSFTAAVGRQPVLAQQYVAFLESLPHGPELGDLSLLVAKPREVNRLCGGSIDKKSQVLGCYASNQMIVPSTGLDTATTVGEYTVRYVLTHEYGHHIAFNRRSPLGRGTAVDLGPKYWASYELVCDLSGQGKLFPGDENAHYSSNPGEAWAEAYARLTYPEQPWTWTGLLRPDAGALAAALKDVTTPWSGNTSQTFEMAADRNSQAFDIPLTLDGSFKVTATAPSGAKLNVTLTSGSQTVPLKHSEGSRTWSLSSGCREKPTETVTVHLQRQGGASGPVSLNVSYAG